MADEPINHEAGTNPPLDTGSQGRSSAIEALDSTLALLADNRRRRLLAYLLTTSDDPVRFDDLLDAVVERESPAPGRISHRERVSINLYHIHLPKLADAGVIDYDPVSGTVEYVGPADLADVIASVEALHEEA